MALMYVSISKQNWWKWETLLIANFNLKLVPTSTSYHGDLARFKESHRCDVTDKVDSLLAVAAAKGVSEPSINVNSEYFRWQHSQIVCCIQMCWSSKWPNYPIVGPFEHMGCLFFLALSRFVFSLHKSTLTRNNWPSSDTLIGFPVGSYFFLQMAIEEVSGNHKPDFISPFSLFSCITVWK